MLFILAATTFVACGGDDEQVPTPKPDAEHQLVEMDFRVNGGSGTRTVLRDGNEVWFQNGDAISIFDSESQGHPFTTTLQQDASTAIFHGHAHKDAATDFYALYPYSANGEKSSYGSTPMIIATLPARQTAVRGTFDPSANLSVAHLKMSDVQQSMPSFTLYNACSLVKFSVSEGLSLKSVKLTGTTTLSGDMGIVMPADLTQQSLESRVGGTQNKEVTLQAEEGHHITAGTYYVAVWPGSHTSLTITLTNAEGKTNTGTMGGVEFKRAKIVDLGTF